MEGPAGNLPTIKPISKSVVHRICAGQVVLDLASAVKELVENSLDAGATNIEITLKEYGLDSFQVIDNGSGISPENYKVLATKHYTSKLADFPDLQSLTTFGFRGEALSSICAVGDLTVETRTSNEVVARHLTYDHNGILIAERNCARQIGTTVTVKKLFSNLPVRSREFKRNIRKEYGKLISLLNAYALISKGVRLVCCNTTAKNVRSVVLKTQGSGSLKENIITVFGSSMFSCLEPLRISVGDGCIVEGFVSKSGYGSGRIKGDRQYFFLNGRPVDFPKVGKLINELYRGANSKQFPIAVLNFSVPTQSCDVNVTPDKSKIFVSNETSILQSLREAMEQIYSSEQASYSVHRIYELNEDMPPCDLNSQNEISEISAKQPLSDKGIFDDETEDKLCTEGAINVTAAQDGTGDSSGNEIVQNGSSCSMIEGFGLEDHEKMKKGYSDAHFEQVLSSVSEKTDKCSPAHSRSSKRGDVDSLCSVQMSLDRFVTANKRKRKVDETPLSEVPLLRSCPIGSKFRESSSSSYKAVRRSLENSAELDKSNSMRSKSSSGHPLGETDESLIHPCRIEKPTGTRDDDKVCLLIPSEEKEHVKATVLQEGTLGRELPGVDHVNSSAEETATEIARWRLPNDSSESPAVLSSPKVGFTLHFSVRDFMASRKRRLSRLQKICHAPQAIGFCGGYGAASLEPSQVINEEGKALAAAALDLERLFKKEDFRKMKVIGQFNLGFIIGKLNHDLFIVDQHAADEKHNYECLAQTTVLNQQPLLQPLKLFLSPEEEIVVSMHMDIFRKNGFLLEEDIQAPPGHRFSLKAVPFSKNITFGLSDVKELVSILSDNHGECSVVGSYRSDTSDSVCPPRVREMLASRACRSSVMIGDSLGRNEMQKIVEHLANLKSPWNCPHGRPTMRHLVDLRTIYNNTQEEVVNI